MAARTRSGPSDSSASVALSSTKSMASSTEVTATSGPSGATGHNASAARTTITSVARAPNTTCIASSTLDGMGESLI